MLRIPLVVVMFGPRFRSPVVMASPYDEISVIVRLLIVKFSSMPPSTSSSANPRQWRERLRIRNRDIPEPTIPPPCQIAIRPVLCRTPVTTGGSFIVPSKSVPSKNPDTSQFVITRFSVIRFSPSPNELFGQIPSSRGEFTRQFEIVVFRQLSTSMPSRFVSIVTLSIVSKSAAGRNDRKMPAMEQRHIANQHLIAKFQRDGLVSTPIDPLLTSLSRDVIPPAVNRPQPRDADIPCRFSPRSNCYEKTYAPHPDTP